MKLWQKLLIGISIAYFLDVFLREQQGARKAKKIADKLGKPLLNVGSGTKKSSMTGAKLRGDINCDLAAPILAPCGKTTVCYCDVQNLSRFKNKQFGVALVANVMQYVPDKEKAMMELQRVADEVVIVDNLLPWMQLGPGPKFRFSA